MGSAVRFRLASVSLIAVLLAACSLLPPPAGIQVTIPATLDVRALPVTVVDHAGIVREAGPADRLDVVETDAIVQAIPGREDAVLLTWMGGACDDRAIVTIDRDGDRFTVAVDTQSSATACSAVGIFRTLMLTLIEPVGAGAFASS
jgi:hypothetical protein